VDAGPQLTALDVCMDAERAMVCGGTRSGKTYFCKQLAYHRARSGDTVFALDPKDQDPNDPWPDGVRVVGASDNFDEMGEFWPWLQDEKARRGRDMANIRRAPFLLIFFDEINDTLFERPDFADHYIRVLRKFAQYRIGIICIGQSDDVASIGLKGLVQLKQCFDLRLLFEHDKMSNTRRSYARLPNRPEMELEPYQPVKFLRRGGSSWTGSERPFFGPGPGTPRRDTDTATPGKHADTAAKSPFFNGVSGVSGVGASPLPYHSGTESYVYDGPERRDIYEAADSRTATIIRMYRSGDSITEICKRVFGGKGGRQSKQVKRILATHGLI